MRRKLLAAIVSGATIFGGNMALAQQHHGHHQADKGHSAAATDTRIQVEFPPALVDHTLANMRDHLMALWEVSDALSRGQNDRAAKVAEERLGMSSLRLHGAQEVAKYMPQGMQDAGTTMHRAASRFAIEAQNADVTGNLKPALGALSEVMSACVACHAGYRLK